MPEDDSIHIGDGAYATFTPYAVLITANHHLSKEASDTVSIEHADFPRLVEWHARKTKEAAE